MSDITTSRVRGPLVALLAAALVLRIGWAIWRPGDDAAIGALPDQHEYLELGRNLLAGRGLVFHDDRLDVDVRAFRTPGYPLLIAACGGEVRAVRVVQAVLDTSSVLAVFLLARRWLSERSSLLAAAIVAVNPYLVYFTGLILSETLFVALLAWGMALLADRRRAPMLAGAALLAMSVLVRPGALLLGPILALAIPPISTSWRRAIVVSLLTLVALLPWAARNRAAVGHWIFTTTNSGFTMYDGFNPDATGGSDQAFVARMKSTLLDMSESDRSRHLNALAWRFIRDNPGRVAALTLAKIARTWSPVPLSREYGGDWKLVAIALIYTVPLFVLMLAGLWAAPLPQAAKLFLLLPAIYFTLAHAASVGSLRYRLPADVPMAVVAAAVLECRMNKQRPVVQ